MLTRLFPPDDWPPLLLLSGTLACLGAAVIMANWTEGTAVVGFTIGGGLLVGWLLAQGTAPWRMAALIHFWYALFATFVYLARFWPGPTLLTGGWFAHSQEMIGRAALFTGRLTVWTLAVARGDGSQETLPFELALGLLGWFCAAYLTWAVVRQKRPWTGLTIAALILALNSYYSRVPLWPLIVYIALAGMLTAVVHFRHFEAEWRRRGSDYSDQLRFDVWLNSAAVVVAVAVVAFLVPALNYQATAQFLRERPFVRQIESGWERLFGGVNLPGPALASPPGQLPRAFLLGDPPELRETLVMTTRVAPPAAPLDLRYWRGVSYDVYDGRGWAISAERREPLAAGQSIPLPPTALTLDASAEVVWQAGDGWGLRYALGEPRQFDHEATLFWRGANDLAQVYGTAGRYTAVGRLSAASPADLRRADFGEISPALLARYTQLPPSLPPRVAELARQVAAPGETAFDQVRLLEQFLRQYEYSLDVDLPPRRADPVDFFLFEMQRGYCDYYASSLAVMARSLGIPARLTTGYLAAAPDAQGQQAIFGNQAHSWTEVYLGEYGWIIFEPTGAIRDGRPAEGAAAAPVEIGPPPIPPAAMETRPVGLWLLATAGLLLALLLLWSWRSNRAEAGLDGVQMVYGRLQVVGRRLGVSPSPAQTPEEFGTQLAARSPDPEADLTRRLVRLFAARQYGRTMTAEQEAFDLWRRLRWPLWRRSLRRSLRRGLRRWLTTGKTADSAD